MVLACSGQPVPRAGDGGPAVKAVIDGPAKLAFDSQRNLFVYEASEDVPPAIREIAAGTHIVATLLTGCDPNAEPQSGDCLGIVADMQLAADDRLLLADSSKNHIRIFDPKSKTLTTIAGNGSREFSGDGGPALAAGIVEPHCVAMDRAGNIFVCDWTNRIRRIDAATGVITTIAGNGPEKFNYLKSIAADATGNLYASDATSHRIRRINPRTGVIETLQATVDTPHDLIFNNQGRLLFLNADGQVTRLDPTMPKLFVIAGRGPLGFDGDGGLATRAKIDAWGMAMDPAGNLLLADWEHNRIRRFDAKTGIITTFAGNGLPKRKED